MLGGHVASLPERTLAEEACDFVASDEGLHTVVDLLTALKASVGTRSCRSVRGLVYRDHGQRRFATTRRRSSPISTARCPASPGICCR